MLLKGEHMTKEQIPRIGVGVLVVRDGALLLGRRIGSHGEATWSAPGGHLEFGESPEECAQRELMEETGLEVDEFIAMPWTHDFFEKENKHYITLLMLAIDPKGEPEVREPDKSMEWEWFALDRLPEPLFLPLVNLRKKIDLTDLRTEKV